MEEIRGFVFRYIVTDQFANNVSVFSACFETAGHALAEMTGHAVSEIPSTPLRRMT